jgi:hypothetical protein
MRLGLPNLGLGVLRRQISLSALAAAMFASGEVGAVYDPSDLTSLYTSRTGGTPFQTEERRNLLLQTENVSSSSWVKVGVTAAPSSAIAPPVAGMAVDKVVGASGVSTTRQYYQSVTVVSGLTYTTTKYYKAAEYDKAVINEIGSGRFGARFDFTAKTATSLGGGGFVSCALTELADGWFRCEVVWISNSTSVAVAYGGYPTGATVTTAGVSYAGDGTSGVYVTGAQNEQNTVATSYQRVGASYDYIGSPVGIMLDKSKMGGLSAAAFIAGQPELVTNGGFDTDTGWTKGTGWTISGGQAVGTSVATSQALRQTIVAPAGDLYVVTLDAVVTAGLFNIWFNTSGIFVGVQTTGRHTFLFRASGANDITIAAGAVAFTGTIDNFSVKRIPGFHAIAPSDAARPILRISADPTIMAAQPELVVNGGFATDTVWTKGTGWTIAAGVASGAALSNSPITQSFAPTQGRRYAFTFSVTAYTSGSIRSLFAGAANILGVARSAIGTYTDILLVDSAATLLRLSDFSAGFTGSVDNVSVKEIPLSAYRFYLETDGVDDWMQVLPALNLGMTWANVGGWLTTKNNAPLYAYGDNASLWQRVFHFSSRLTTINSAQAAAGYLSSSDILNNLRVLTVEKTETTAMSGRINGVQEVAPIVPYNDTADGKVLSLFSNSGTSFSGGFGGRFYGGVWINRALTASERTNLEQANSRLAGVTF